MSQPPLILVVDDEPHITQLARMYLEREGYHVHSVGDGEAALRATAALAPDAIVLDIMLPKLDGLEVCRRLRAESNPVPIIMLTARDDDYDKILGLELGADDYLTKPFNPRELVARVKALLRREQFTAAAHQQPVRLGNTWIAPAAREVTVNDTPVPLRAQEFDLLWVLVQHRGRVLTREQLLQMAWGYDYAGQTRTVDVHIAHLRKKLAASDIRIETVTGVGYKLVV